jgi:hypothetical protein
LHTAACAVCLCFFPLSDLTPLSASFTIRVPAPPLVYLVTSLFRCFRVTDTLIGCSTGLYTPLAFCKGRFSVRRRRNPVITSHRGPPNVSTTSPSTQLPINLQFGSLQCVDVTQDGLRRWRTVHKGMPSIACRDKQHSQQNWDWMANTAIATGQLCANP